jgi:phosphoglucosamine mutase
MPKELFGTDGIRGVAGEPPLDKATVYAAGRALGELVEQLDPSPEVVVGTDTRESGPELARLLAAGLEQAGVPARFAGVIPTAGLAYLTHTDRFVAGVMISASHNPYQDNGIKVFAHSGYKLPDEQEEQVEAGIRRLCNGDTGQCELSVDGTLLERYVEYLARCYCGPPKPGLRVVVDGANGAAYEAAPRLLAKLGLEAEFLAVEPNGRNINLDCGSLHLGGLRRRVLESKADLGVAFDGDADRALFISGSGREVNGDAVLWMAARQLRTPLVVTTTMANLGLEKALAGEGISMVRTQVGDKYVLEEMLRRDAELGGEQSGHVIFRRWATTGDGLLTAIKVLEMVSSSGRNLDEWTADLPVYPQTIRNVRVRTRAPLHQVPAVFEALQAGQRELNGRGRIVVRYSGTEPLIRVMVEAETVEEVDRHASRLVEVISDHLGS